MRLISTVSSINYSHSISLFLSHLQLFHATPKPEDWVSLLLDHVKLSNMRNRRLASYEEGSFCHAFLPQFAKFVKLSTDTIADITNLMGRIEKKVMVFVVSEGQSPGGDLGVEGVKDPRGRKDPSVFRGNRMCLDEAEEVCQLAAGMYVCISVCLSV